MDRAEAGKHKLEYVGSSPGGILLVSISQLTRSDSGQYRCGIGRLHRTFEVTVSDGETRNLKNVLMSAGFLWYICVFVLLTDPTALTPNVIRPVSPPSVASGSTPTPERGFTSESEQQTRTTPARGRSTAVCPNTFTSIQICSGLDP